MQNNDVLIITTAEPNLNQGGPGKFLYQMAKTHNDLNSDLHVRFFWESKNDFESVVNNADSMTVPAKRYFAVKFKDLLKLCLDAIPIVGPITYILRAWGRARASQKHVQSNTSIINAHDFLQAYYFCFSKHRKKLVVTSHAKGSNYFESVRFKRRFYSRLDFQLCFQHIERAVIKRCKKLTFPSEEARSLLIRDYPALRQEILEKSTVIYSGCIPIEPASVNEKRNNSGQVLSIANHIPAKNILRSVDVLRGVKKKGVEFRFINCGATGPDTQEMTQRIERYGLEEQVLIKGPVDPATIGTLFRSADCFLITSDMTVFDLVVLEAMSAGVPIVCTDLQGFSEALGEAYPYLCRTDEELINGVSELLSCQKLREGVGAELRERFFLNFTLENMCKRYDDFYKTQIEDISSSRL